jgi:hypothetical protein
LLWKENVWNVRRACGGATENYHENLDEFQRKFREILARKFQLFEFPSLGKPPLPTHWKNPKNLEYLFEILNSQVALCFKTLFLITSLFSFSLLCASIETERIRMKLKLKEWNIIQLLNKLYKLFYYWTSVWVFVWTFRLLGNPDTFYQFLRGLPTASSRTPKNPFKGKPRTCWKKSVLQNKTR